MSVTQGMEQYQSIVEEEVDDITWETGVTNRKVKVDVATFVQSLIIGF